MSAPWIRGGGTNANMAARRCCATSAVTNRGSTRWMAYKGALDGAMLIRFTGRLVRQAKGRKVYLILDNLRVHHCAPVKAWIDEHREQIAPCIICPTTARNSTLTSTSTARSKASWGTCQRQRMNAACTGRPSVNYVPATNNLG